MTKTDKTRNDMGALDGLFIAFLELSFVIPVAAGYYGIDTRFLWIPTFALFLWSLYIVRYRAKVMFADLLELSLIERMRGWMYMVTLVITFVLNGLAAYLFLASPSLTTFIINFVIEFPVVLALLEISVRILPRSLFEKYWFLFDARQKQGLKKVLDAAGTASIFFSIEILTLQNIMLIEIRLTIFSLLLYLFLFSCLIAVYRIERKSRILASDLADSLEKTRLIRRFEKLKGRQRIA